MAGLKDTLVKSVKNENKTDSKSERLFDKSKKAWSISENYLENFKDKIIRRYAMYNSQHYETEKYCEENYNRNKHYVPKSHEFVKNSVSQVVQAYFLNPDFVYLTPEVSEDIVSVMSAEYFSYVLNKRLKSKQNWWLTFIEMTAQSGFIHNMCIAKVDWNIDDKISIAVPIVLERLRIDPYADPLDPIGTSSFIIHKTEMYVDDLKAKQEEDGWLEFSIEDLQENFVSSMSEDEEIETARYRDGYDPKQGQQGVDAELQKVFVHENIIRENNKYYVFYTLGTTKMLTKVFNLKDIYPQGLPFVMAPLYPEEMKIYSAAPLDHAYPSQKLINDYTNTVMDAVEQVTWPVTIVKANSGFDIKKFQKVGPNSVVEARNPQSDVYQLNKQVAPQSLKNEIPYLMNNFDSTVGGLPNSTVAMEGGDSTATGQNMRYRSQSQVINMYLMNYNEKFIEPVLELMLKCEKIFGLKDDKFVGKVFKNTGLLQRYNDKLVENGFDPENFEINKEFADADLNLSVNVGMGATSPQLRIEQFLASVNAIRNLVPNVQNQLDTQEIIKELMTLNGYKDYNRFFTTTEDPRIGELQAQIQQLQQQLMQKKTPEEVQADVMAKQATAQEKMKKVELLDAQINKTNADTIATKVTTQQNALTSAEKLAVMPEIAVGGDKIMENAGAVDPTPQDPMF